MSPQVITEPAAAATDRSPAISADVAAAERRLVPVIAQRTAAASQALTFDVAAKIDLTLIFKRFGPLPAVVGSHDQTGPWDVVGQSRKPQLGDGTSAFEELTAWHAPWYFEYEVSRFTHPLLRSLVSGARGDWKFTPVTAGGTQITWTYSFRPLRYRKTAVRLLIAPLWRGYMRRALERCVDEVERQAPDGAQSRDRSGERAA